VPANIGIIKVGLRMPKMIAVQHSADRFTEGIKKVQAILIEHLHPKSEKLNQARYIIITYL